MQASLSKRTALSGLLTGSRTPRKLVRASRNSIFRPNAAIPESGDMGVVSHSGQMPHQPEGGLFAVNLMGNARV